MDLEVLKIASNTVNHKIINDHTHISKQKNPILRHLNQKQIKTQKYMINNS